MPPPQRSLLSVCQNRAGPTSRPTGVHPTGQGQPPLGRALQGQEGGVEALGPWGPCRRQTPHHGGSTPLGPRHPQGGRPRCGGRSSLLSPPLRPTAAPQSCLEPREQGLEGWGGGSCPKPPCSPPTLDVGHSGSQCCNPHRDRRDGRGLNMSVSVPQCGRRGGSGVCPQRAEQPWTSNPATPRPRSTPGALQTWPHGTPALTFPAAASTVAERQKPAGGREWLEGANT